MKTCAASKVTKYLIFKFWVVKHYCGKKEFFHNEHVQGSNIHPNFRPNSMRVHFRDILCGKLLLFTKSGIRSCSTGVDRTFIWSHTAHVNDTMIMEDYTVRQLIFFSRLKMAIFTTFNVQMSECRKNNAHQFDQSVDFVGIRNSSCELGARTLTFSLKKISCQVV